MTGFGDDPIMPVSIRMPLKPELGRFLARTLAGWRLEDNEKEAIVLMPGRAGGVETVVGVWLVEGTPTVARNPGNSLTELADVFPDDDVVAF